LIRAVAAALVLLAGPALAQGSAILSIEFGRDRMDVAPTQILTVEVKNDYGVPFVMVTLDRALQGNLATLTQAHVGEVGRIRVCGRVVSEPMLQSPITEATFVISTGDLAELRDLARILQAKTCTPDATS
jgi:preprotein translocase subunit SecD